MTAGAPWSHDENVAAIDDYLDMLVKELMGERYNKAEHNRRLCERLSGRSRESVELKHPNISQALIDLGQPYIDGYKPRPHYQRSLLDTICERLDARPDVAQLLAQVATSSPAMPPEVSVDVFELPPFGSSKAKRLSRETPSRESAQPVHVDWVAREASNSALGASGEDFVLRVEHHRLRSLGQKRLAERIDHVSVSRGDGLGYDIHSYEADGRDRLIEVKTTRSGRCSPFFVTRSEVDASTKHLSVYHLYRVFSFAANPRIFVVSGSLPAQSGLLLSPVVYRASIT